ncbi:acyl carrier protein [Candidatus Magnetomorum sp. HK-1]|nr:acyl carrier protein [Candidatus Magnetomorum sp. HK-1]
MLDRKKAVEAILDIIHNINENLNAEDKIPVSEETVIFGKNSMFDSLRFLHLISAIEEWIEDELDLIVTLATEDVMFEKEGPFKSVLTLADHVIKVVTTEMENQADE